MARGMNRVTIIGFVERDPEMRRTASRQPVASFPVSTNRRWTTNSGEAREATEWFNIVAWGDLAEAVVRLLQKDRRIYAEGHLQSRTWQDVRGQQDDSHG